MRTFSNKIYVPKLRIKSPGAFSIVLYFATLIVKNRKLIDKIAWRGYVFRKSLKNRIYMRKWAPGRRM